MNFAPSIKNIAKTNQELYASIYLLTAPIPKYPKIGIMLCESPIVIASAREFLTLFFVKINPCENETTRQSTPNAILKNINSAKCKLPPQTIYSKGIYM